MRLVICIGGGGGTFMCVAQLLPKLERGLVWMGGKVNFVCVVMLRGMGVHWGSVICMYVRAGPVWLGLDPLVTMW